MLLMLQIGDIKVSCLSLICEVMGKKKGSGGEGGCAVGRSRQPCLGARPPN